MFFSDADAHQDELLHYDEDFVSEHDVFTPVATPPLHLMSPSILRTPSPSLHESDQVESDLIYTVFACVMQLLFCKNEM